MRAVFALCAALAGLGGAAPAAAAADWRFGFEWNENWPWSPPFPEDPAHDQLLERLAAVAPGGAINVNGHRGWGAMQSGPGKPIDFADADAIQRLFQEHGFEPSFYLDSNARWAWVDPAAPARLGASMAPAPDKEDDWQAFVRAVVERYDGDGVADMPGLLRPIRFYVLTGEVFFDRDGRGDAADAPFWKDSIENLLRLHRLTYAALRQADPSGETKLVGSGAVLWDLYADFPDYPEFDPADPASAIRRRLAGENFRGSVYTQGWADLKKLLRSYGDDGDGIECDYVGWHPHWSWRVLDQEFALIRALTKGKPIYVDDMWANLFPAGYGGAAAVPPGEAQFNATPSPQRAWVEPVNGDFPNALIAGADPYGELFDKLAAGNAAVTAFYHANGARRLVKSFVSAFGEGAERVSFSGTNDTRFFGLVEWEIGWLNLLGRRDQGYAEKPQAHALRRLHEELHDFLTVEEIAVAADPRTRVYRFDRARGPVWIGWSETGGPPPGLDYATPNGETVTIPVAVESVLAGRFPQSNAAPAPQILAAPGGDLTLRLGYEPVIVEPQVEPCAADDTTLCLGTGDRFRLRARFRAAGGAEDDARVVRLTADTGYLWFFAASNVEVVAKVLDGCGLNQRFWFFAGGLTDVEVTLTLLDTATGASRVYRNPAGTAFAPIQDTAAVVTCP